MMRRFSRRRRGGGTSAAPTAGNTDPAAVFRQMVEQQIVPAESLEPYPADEVPAGFATIGRGESKQGGPILVSFSSRHGSHAVLAALAIGTRLAQAESFSGEIYVVAPDWVGAGRRLFGLIGQLPYRVTAVTAPGLAEGGAFVAPEQAVVGAALSPSQIAGHLARPADRDLFLRAARGLEGLAAKHGGALRGYGRALEFVLLAKRVAELRAEDDGVVLTTILPQRSRSRLASETLSGSLDGLEGQLRKRLNDRRTRQGEEGLRARAVTAFRTWHSLRALVPWPLGGPDGEVIDWVGVDVEGRPVIGAAREQVGLQDLAAIIEGTLGLQGSLPSVLAHAAPPVVLDAPRLVVGGSTIAPGVGHALDALVLSHELFEITPVRDTELELRPIGAGEAASPEPRRRRPSGRGRRDGAAERSSPDGEASGEVSDAKTEETGAAASEGGAGNRGGAAGEDGAEARSGSGGRGRSRRGRGRRGRGRRSGGGRDGEEKSEGASDGDSRGEARASGGFDEVSLFDLDDEPAEREGGGAGRGRRRGRGRGRGRGGSGDDSRGGGRSADDASSAGNDAPELSDDQSSGAGRPQADPDDADLDDGMLVDDDAELGLDSLPDVPEFEAPAEPNYDDEEEMGDEGESDAKARTRERKQRQAPQIPVEVPRLARRRGAIVAHADPDSILAAILIARDIRMVEGIWIYPQDELMNFFRGVTTDLRDDTPIYVVGFTPRPVVDVLQAASLYRERIMWFDHQSWPPEDLQALRDAIGEDAVDVSPGCGSSLPIVIDACSRQSRFTDKLVDLAAARFTQHDYERWGRLWSWRLSELTKKTGDRRADLEGLLSGRPSDLAREAANAETPPIPPEVEYVSRRDFRLVHFAGYGLVVLEVPDELDLHLTARIVRERYGASLSLARRPEGECLVFAGDELVGRRSLDLGGLVEHVANKLEWVEQLADSDHVARMRVRDLAAHPDRVDEIVAEIAMGRSILER